jgi:hypothetical protein
MSENRAYFKVNVSGGCDPFWEGDSEDAYDRADTWTDHTLESVHASEVERYMDNEFISFPLVAGETVYVLHAQWSTGDSFGNDEGSGYEIVGVYKTLAEAEMDKATLEAADNNSYKPVTLLHDIPYHIPWHGYFESLDWLEINAFMVQP